MTNVPAADPPEPATGPHADRGGPDHGEPTAGPRGERRWLPAAVVVVLVAIPFATPLPEGRLLAWLLPIVALPLLVAVMAADPGRIDRRDSALRVLSISLTGVLGVTALVATGRLVYELVQGAPNLHDAPVVLTAGLLVWTEMSLTFALLFWELDGGGSAERLAAPRPDPDLAFPQHLNPEVAPPDWRPTFPDYLYLGLTNALAFSPTDAMPLRHWAKALMAVQAITSVVILSLVIANAVNTLT
jgi:hypothetical protein